VAFLYGCFIVTTGLSIQVTFFTFLSFVYVPFIALAVFILNFLNSLSKKLRLFIPSIYQRSVQLYNWHCIEPMMLSSTSYILFFSPFESLKKPPLIIVFCQVLYSPNQRLLMASSM